MEATQNEEWRAIEGYEGAYEVSNQGRVRSLTRRVQRGSREMTRQGQLLKPRPLISGHVQVNLGRDGKSTNHYVHRLVATAFLADPDTRREVRHLNGQPDDNRVENLAWGSRSENMYDRRAHGVDHEVLKTHCPRKHRLIAPNLRAAMSRSGHRGCLACNRAFAAISYRGLPKSDLQQLSDSYYQAIMVEGIAS